MTPGRLHLLLRPGEQLIWSDKPSTTLRIDSDIVVAGLLLIALGVGASLLLGREHDGGYIPWILHAPIIGLGAGLIMLLPFVDARRRRKTRYVLTNQRAMVVLESDKLKLASQLPLTPKPRIEVLHGRLTTVSLYPPTSDYEERLKARPLQFRFVSSGQELLHVLDRLIASK